MSRKKYTHKIRIGFKSGTVVDMTLNDDMTFEEYSHQVFKQEQDGHRDSYISSDILFYRCSEVEFIALDKTTAN